MRQGQALDRVLLCGLKLVSIILAIFYLIGLIYLFVRGGRKLITFTLYASPLSGANGEPLMRILIGAAAGALLGWVSGWPVHCTLLPMTKLNAKQKLHVLNGITLVSAVGGALLMRNHLPRFLWSFPSELTSGGGVGPELFNTVYLAFLSTLMTAPIGIGAAVYLAHFARSYVLRTSVRMALDTLASLPSILYGLFGFLLFVVVMGTGYSLMAGACALSLLNLPLIVGVAEESIRAVPRELEDASMALGATRIQTLWYITLPYAWPGVFNALLLSVGRVFSESAPLIMTAGTTVSRTNAYSLNPMRGGETLAVHLWYVNSNGLSPDREQISASTAALLVALVIVTNLLTGRLSSRGYGRSRGEQGIK